MKQIKYVSKIWNHCAVWDMNDDVEVRIRYCQVLVQKNVQTCILVSLDEAHNKVLIVWKFFPFLFIVLPQRFAVAGQGGSF